MIVAGIFNQVNENTFETLASITSNRISNKTTYFKNNFVNVIAGETSRSAGQGNIISLENALLIGKVFSKNDNKTITEKDLEQQLYFSNQMFVKKYWGNYLYIKIKDRLAIILRDPVGQFPLFYTKLASGEILFSSEIEILSNMMKKIPGFNWKYFTSYLLHSSITTEQTAFSDIYELPHGCQISFNSSNNSIERTIVWNPLDYIHDYKGSEYAKSKIIDITVNVIKNWTKNTKILSLEFSGGTDSTGLLFLLKKIANQDQKIELVNFFDAEVASSDERKYARQTAKNLSLDLIEFDLSLRLPFDAYTYTTSDFKPNWPTSQLCMLKLIQDIEFLHRNNKNVLYISGQGGDHVFMCPPPIGSLCDYLIEKGKKGFDIKLKEISMMFRKPLFPILQEIVKGMILYKTCTRYSQSVYRIDKEKKAPWFNKELYLLEKQVHYHPFFYEEKTTQIAPGKFNLIETIYSGLSTIKTDIRDHGTNPVFYPLCSQPLLELILSIPTYETYKDGYDRYLFRRAISDTFNTNVVWRKDKGETTGNMQRGLKKHKEYLLDLCLNGNLVKMNLINREKLQDSILAVMYGQIDYQWQVINTICAEIFMNYWKK